jgi:hypothetical protein
MSNTNTNPRTAIAFAGTERIASGEMPAIVLAVKHAVEADPWTPVLIFDYTTSERIELDLRGTDDEALARLVASLLPKDTPAEAQADDNKPTGPGRPKLGVVAREVTLLPRHWDWLNGQPGGASVALRKLVEEARRASAGKERIRQAQEITYRFLSAIAGNLPNFEEVNRALFAGNGERFVSLTATWPNDIRDHAQTLAATAFSQETEE